MEINDVEELKLQKSSALTNNATNYPIAKENVTENNLKIFEHYDTDKNNNLDKVEMSGLRADIYAANSDKNVGKLNKKRSQSAFK